MALVPPLEEAPEAVQALLAPLRHDFSIVVHRCENPFAVGAIIRVAHNFLAREIIVVGGGSWYEKASMGMEKYERITRVENDEELFAHVKGRPVWALEKDGARRSLYAVSAFPRDVVLLFGSERFGISKTVLDACDDVLGIPIYGVNHSLPVAVAAGIAMSEWARLRYAGGTLR